MNEPMSRKYAHIVENIISPEIQVLLLARSLEFFKDKKLDLMDIMHTKRLLHAYGFSFIVDYEEFHKTPFYNNRTSQIFHGRTVRSTNSVLKATKKSELACSEMISLRELAEEKHVINMHGVLIRCGVFYIKIEHMPYGDMYDWLLNNYPTPDILAMPFLHVIKAIQAVHALNWVHRDIKPENILIRKNLRTGNIIFKLADFGHAVRTNHNGTCVKNIVGSDSYMSPEICDANRIIDKSTDIWSFGALMHASLEMYSTNCADYFIKHPKGNPYDISRKGMVSWPNNSLYQRLALKASLINAQTIRCDADGMHLLLEQNALECRRKFKRDTIS